MNQNIAYNAGSPSLFGTISIGHVDRVTMSDLVGPEIEPKPPAPIAMSVITQPTDWHRFLFFCWNQTTYNFFSKLFQK